MFRKICLTTTTIIAGFLSVSVAFAQDYDLVINNGRVMDPETLFDSVANVAVKDGRIVAITKDALKGTETVDATGHIVAPGFVDTHFHFQMPVGYSLGLRDGLTTAMDFEMGCAGSYMADWYEARAGVTVANYGCAVSHESARAMFIDGSKGDYLKDGPVAALTTRAKTGWSATR
ncbi:MAG: hydrolase, partial [Anderseniella sp.]|nr:hydrolase [Anderseniella sp.]